MVLRTSGGGSGGSGATASTNGAFGRHEFEVFLGRTPLVGLERLTLALPPGLRAPLRLHSFVLLDVGSECWLYDFLPEAPTAPGTAAGLLSGRAVRGQARRRRLAGRAPKQLPVGAALRSVARLVRCDALAVADAFTEAWGTELTLATRNCRHHTDALIAALLAAEQAGGR
ncbi:hypothetical protein Rsub_06635 [Raphidocelis subcapitata]|uniref:Uncharacterized protein n=1 Tax=Raphidocelis subcapitata TaxID=307507 RepID=A0A2V0P3M4_9CHLO|nr:hypothetical protein Rsub_06635 [Raphidocelis subcapitata]|eukprot:GBF93502.1 hypothetical protein Rsub_06635 [Raphidocelis subcapitata]